MSNANPSSSPIQIVQAGPDRLDVLIGGELFTSYRCDPALYRPYLYPVISPVGESVTADAPGDHRHHHSIWIGHGEVNGVNLWSEFGGEGRIAHERFESIGDADFTVLSRWQAPDGRPLMRDQRVFAFSTLPGGGRVIDLHLILWAAYGRVVLGGTKEAGFPHVRVADSVDVKDGGRITNSEGGINEAGTFGQRARWCDYSGPSSRGTWHGIAVFDHPSNLEHPTPWFTRDYGPFSPNFIFYTGARTLEEGETLAVRYRLYVHAGDALEGQVAQAYQSYIDGFTDR